MKKLLPVLICLVASFFDGASYSQVLQPPPLINVSGSAEVKVTPDQVYLNVGVETRDAKLDVATRQNDEQVAKALTFLKDSGINGKDVQTDYISIDPQYHNEDPSPFVYVARKSLQIKLSKVEAMQSILTGLLSNGINHVEGVDFRTSELRKHRDAARLLAVRAAKEKATALASELGVTMDKVYAINASDFGGYWTGRTSWGGSRNGGMTQNVSQNLGGVENPEDGALSIGQISVSATVNVSFLIK